MFFTNLVNGHFFIDYRKAKFKTRNKFICNFVQ